MSKLKDRSSVHLSVQQQVEFEQGLVQLKARRNKMRASMMLSLLLGIMALVALYFNQQLVYAIFEISPTLQQLHVPFSAQSVQDRIGGQNDYFSHLIQWILWLGLKLSMSFVGAILLIFYAKKLSFFKQKFKGFVQTTLAFVISFILLWAGLSFAQYEWVGDDPQQEQYLKAVEYQTNIQQSDVYRYIQQSKIDEPVADYLLAQTAILHRPIDREVALAYLSKLAKVEQNDASQMVANGFKPEQLWMMQHQIYGKAVTPFAETVQTQVNEANRIVQIMRLILIALIISFAVLMVIFYLLNWRLSKRLERIEQQLLH
ncbi:hypothetical protein [Acinetobacter sp.]|uniref:hypothetical protein n=1 Tax=Acinetobacter sp. TaxID=472 RepID=UPI0035AEF634